MFHKILNIAPMKLGYKAPGWVFCIHTSSMTPFPIKFLDYSLFPFFTLPWILTFKKTLYYLKSPHATCIFLAFYCVCNLDNSGENKVLIYICLVEWSTWRKRGDLFFPYDLHLKHTHCVPQEDCVTSFTLWESPYILTRTSVELV